MATQLLTPAQAIARARMFTRYPVGQCLRFVSDCLTGGRFLDVPAPYALHAWANAKRRHTTGTPPPGAPVYFDHGRVNEYGHIALSIGDRRIRTTGLDPNFAGVGDIAIDELARRWGQKYLGWSEDLYGNPIPGLLPTPAPKPAPTPQEDDMPTVQEIWRWDGIPSPDRDPANPNWQPDSYLRETFRLVRSTKAEVVALSAAIEALAKGQGVDPAAVKAAVNEALAAYTLRLEKGQ